MSTLAVQQPSIVPVMIGTAGHVDHGKTALVKLLTGCDTDTLPEEKERGLSIDLGFAPFLLRGDRMVGIIDVPGHEDFIRNMVAGASSMDVLILVIAADDGIMPQTIEHLKIVSLLRTPQVMAVITKADLVSGDRQQKVKENVICFLTEHGFPDAPVILESNKTGEGIADVRKAVDQLVGSVKRPLQERAFRMDIERVFSVQGYGTVVTGIPSSGSCVVGDALELFPGPQRTSCRAIQKYSRESKDTQAHVCSAINLNNSKASDIERGMTLAAPGVYRQVSQAILSIRNVHESLAIKRKQEMRFCCGTSARVVSCLLLGTNNLGPGECGFMQIRLSNPAVLAAGDRFILRSLSPSATVAGGVVVTVNCDRRGKKLYFKAELLEAARTAAENDETFLSELTAGNPLVISHQELPFLTQSREEYARKIVNEKAGLGILMPLGPSRWAIQCRLPELESKLRDALSRYHKENTVSRGMPASAVCSLLGLDNKCLSDLRNIFAENSSIAVHEDHFSLRGFRPELNARQQALKEKIITSVSTSSKSAIAIASLQAQLRATGAELHLLVRLLSEEGIVAVLDEHLIDASIVNECLNRLYALFETETVVELRSFRQATGLSRNIAVPMLELFDSRGITCREEKGRKLLRKEVSLHG